MFKVGDKVRCLRDNVHKNLTLNKVYEVLGIVTIDMGREYVIIINDVGRKSQYFTSRFVAENPYEQAFLEKLRNEFPNFEKEDE